MTLGFFQIPIVAGGTPADELAQRSLSTGTFTGGFAAEESDGNEGTASAAGRIGGVTDGGLAPRSTRGMTGIGGSDCGAAGEAAMGATCAGGGGATGCETIGSALADAFAAFAC